MEHFMQTLYGDAIGNSLENNLTQFQIPSTRASQDAEIVVGDTAYATPLGEAPSHIQTKRGSFGRLGKNLQNPTTDPFARHTFLIVGGAIVALFVMRRAFKGAVI